MANDLARSRDPCHRQGMEMTWDCIVVGGGAAGLSAALVLGRARRSTLVVDAGEQSNRPSEGIGGLLGHDHRPPADFYALGRNELAAYPSVEVRDGVVATARRDGEAFVLELDGGAVETARTVLLATGTDYRLPDLPGVAERWGRAVFHCPFCHGWEHRDGKLGVLGATALHRVPLLRMWSDDVTLLTDGAELEPEEAERLATQGVEVDDRRVARVDDPGATVVFDNGERRECTGLLVPVTLHQRSPLAAQLGAGFAEPGPVAAEALAVDERFRTTVPGLLAAGDATTQMPSVASAVAAGHSAAAAVVSVLMSVSVSQPA
jgi:thioredoxin reductase